MWKDGCLTSKTHILRMKRRISDGHSEYGEINGKVKKASCKTTVRFRGKDINNGYVLVLVHSN